MRLSAWAKKEGLNYHTAHNWVKNDQMPVPWYKTPTGTIIVQVDEDKGIEDNYVLYARVSSSDQKKDLERQLGRLMLYASEKGYTVSSSITEVGSGLNPNRAKLKKILRDPKLKTIIVEHRERLTRFGFEYLEAALKAQGRNIIVVDDKEIEDDIVRDMTEVLTSMCARLYGKRSAKNRAKKALEAIEQEQE